MEENEKLAAAAKELNESMQETQRLMKELNSLQTKEKLQKAGGCLMDPVKRKQKRKKRK